MFRNERYLALAKTTKLDDTIDRIKLKTLIDPTALENIKNCSTYYKLKLVYLEGMDKCGDALEAETFHMSFREGKIRKGPKVNDLDPSEGLGFLVREETFKRYHSRKFKMDSATFEVTYENWMRYYAARHAGRTPSNAERLAANAFLRSPLPTRLDGEVWLFRNPSGHSDAFDGIVDGHLPTRLGLLLVPGERRLTMGFFAKNVEAVHRPRFLDASWGYLNLWDWRGMTRPLPGTPASVNGLREVVAKPPLLRDLNRPIEAIAI